MTSIGGDWVSNIDPSSGCPYYTNTVTGETSWDYPTELGGNVSQGGQWIETYDESSGSYYYLNDVTGESTWEKPENYVPASGAGVDNAEAEENPANWTSGVDNGNTWYYNNITGTTLWERPACLGPVEATEPPAPVAEVEEPAEVTPVPAVKRASVLPPPAIKSSSATTSSTAATTEDRPKSIKRASFQPPPVLPKAATEKTPIVLPTVNVQQRQAELAAIPEESSLRSSIGISENEASAIGSVSDMKSKLGAVPMRMPGQPVPPGDGTDTPVNAADTPPPPPAPPVADPAPSVSSSGTAPPPVDPPKPTSRKSKQQSFAALRALESVDEESETTTTGGDASMIEKPSMAVANEYVTNSSVTSVLTERSIHRLISKDDKTTEELIAQVAGLTLEQYGEKFFNFDRKGVFKSRTTIDKLLSWKSELIKTSLRVLSSEMVTEAVQLFRNVTGYMGDRNSAKAPTDHAFKILNHMMLAPEELRDELFCQLCKQTNNNPDPVSCEKGWQLMMICLAIFPPSSDLMPHLMAYCASKLHSDVPNVGNFAEICLHRIPKICRLGPRRELPTKIELEAMKRGGTVCVRVFFLDDKYCILRADSWTTARETEDTLAKILNIANDKPFSLFEVSTGEEERVLDPDERILDLVSFWQRTELEDIAKVGKSATIEEFKFQYKVGLFYDVEDSDTSAIELMYVQATHDVVDSRYPCSEQDAITLAALQMQEAFGDFPSSGECSFLKGKLGLYLSSRLIEQFPAAELEEKVYKLYKKLTGYSQMEARLSYLDYVKSWKIYGSTYFFAEPQNNKDLPRECVLAINNKGILVVDPNSKEFLAEYDYSNVVTWGHSANSFVVVTGSTNRQIKMYFKTDQGKEINNMVRCYVENRMA